MDISITTPATATSISRELVKESKRIVHDAENNLIDFWIKVADEYVEKAANISLMERTLTLNISRVLPWIQLPFPPLKAVADIEAFTYTVDGQTEVIVNPATDISMRTVYMLPSIKIPALTKSYDGSMSITYKAGYTTPEAVPSGLRQAALLLVGHYLSHRDASLMDPKAILIDRKIVFGVGEHIAQWRIPNTNETINEGF